MKLNYNSFNYALVPPKSDEDITKWANEYPDVAGIVETIAEKKAKELLQSGKHTSTDWEDEESRQKVYENKLQRSVVRQAVAKFQ